MDKGDFVKIFIVVLVGALCIGAVGLTVCRAINKNRSEDYQEEARQKVVLLGDEPQGAVTVTPVSTTQTPSAAENVITPSPEPDMENELTPSVTPTPSEGDKPKSIVTSGFDLTQLMRENKDIIGWIRIPGTEIDYPLLQDSGSGKYLNTAYDGKTKTDFGSIFTNNVIEGTVEGEENLVIYGHNMRTAGYGMFTSLMKYKDASYQNAHKKLELYFPDGVRTYQLFAVYSIKTTDSFRFDKMAFGGKADFENYIADVQKRSVYSSGVAANASSRLVTLSTCDRDYDWESGRLIVVFIQR